jgi:hypothetical protein
VVARILVDHAAALDANDAPRDRQSALRLRREAVDLARRLEMPRLLARMEAAGWLAAESPSIGEPVAARAVLKLDGDVWIVGYRGRSARLKALKGFHYLRRLLERPGRAFNVLDLVALEGGTAVHADVDLGPVLDERAKAELRARVRALRVEADEAERDNDRHRTTRLREEAERICDELARALGLGGRDRRPGATSERARASVTKAIHAGIRAIARCEPALSDVLRRTIRTGTFCWYHPLDEAPIEWDLDASAQ